LTLDQTGMTSPTGITLTGDTAILNNNTAVTIKDNIGGTGDLSIGRTGASGNMNVTGNINMTGRLIMPYVLLNGGTYNASPTLSGNIGTNVTGIVITSNGILALTGTNTYTSDTTLYAGSLKATEGTGLPTASHLVLDGGVYVVGSNFTPFARYHGQHRVVWPARRRLRRASATASVNIGGAGRNDPMGLHELPGQRLAADSRLAPAPPPH